MNQDPQLQASDPRRSSFVTANAGSGKTRTLVDRVARLLLRGSEPAAILCVTYTKAAAAEMQRRLFQTLGEWAVMPDERLTKALADIDEAGADPSTARRLFARALETPGGLKIQTIHAFCEKLLRRFPLEAGVSPGFKVLEDQAAREVSGEARELVARAALERPESALGQAYAQFAVQLDYRSFGDMFAAFEARRRHIKAYDEALDGEDALAADVWGRCGFAEAAPVAEQEAEALANTEWSRLAWAAEALLASTAKTDQTLGARLRAAAASEGAEGFDAVWGLYCTQAGKPLAKLGTNAVDPDVRAVLEAEQTRLGDACDRIRAARIAEDTLAALTLAIAYDAVYEGAKAQQAALDFGDLIDRTRQLLTERADAAWVLYKLDGGVDHILVDEAQDTAPDQWDIVRALSMEFFAGSGAREEPRTVFAVGDEKQSIFSFQGADPERFARESAEYQDLVHGSGASFDRPALLKSWRSAPEILAFVDAVFADPEATAALRPEGEVGPVRHEATRPEGGAVDLWPLEESDPSLESEAWDDPVDAEAGESANRKLARRIARQVRAMVEGGERAGGVPLTYGDVLILVRRRRALFHEMIRALKREGVPVGGADRLTLSEHVVFQDLLGLARFCLYPWDDLTLAALLRSPLCDVDEDSLYALAQPRGSASLWAALASRCGERPEWASAHALLDAVRAESRQRAPFDLFARLLNRTDGAGRSMRARILTRLGREAEQALDAFLAEALAAERRGVRDLEGFAADLAASEVEVKREQEDGKGEVRVMTVHGSKGLEAKLVILPDTTTRASPQGGPLIDAEGGGFLWCARKADDGDASAAARQRRVDAGDRESLRLLYVALTRARDRLIVCGVKPSRDAYYQRSWHDFISRALTATEVAGRLHEVVEDDGWSFRRYGPDPARAPAEARATAEEAAPPGWAGRPAPREPEVPRYASPSRMAETDFGPSPSPLAAQGGLGRFRRGELVHRLLQVLPELEPAARPAAARSLLDRERDLTPEQRDEMIAAARAVLDDERFAAVFGPGSRAEVAIAGGAPDLPEGITISGRIDRLLVEPGRVLVADYKTNRPSPDRIEDADEAYVTQMAVYAAVLRTIFPGRTVEAALVWTDGPKLMAVPENMMVRALLALPRSG